MDLESVTSHYNKTFKYSNSLSYENPFNEILQTSNADILINSVGSSPGGDDQHSLNIN